MTSTRPEYRTVSLHEWHLIGPDGLPARHRTMQVIRALRPGFSTYRYRFDRQEASLSVVRGVTAGEPYVDVENPGLTVVELHLPRPLEVNETASFEYETRFTWRSVPPPQFRRAARNRVEHVDIRVVFSPERLPADVHWALWDGFGEDARLRAAEEVALDAHHSVHRFVERLEGHTVGFTWTWPRGQEPVVSLQ